MATKSAKKKATAKKNSKAKKTAAKKTAPAKKAAAKKTAVTKKAPLKKAAAKKKSAAKKTAAKKTAQTASGKVKKKAAKAEKKSPAKKAKKAAKKASSSTSAAKKAAVKSPSSTTSRKGAKADDKTTELVKSALEKRNLVSKQTPAVFKLPKSKNTPVVFSLDEVRDFLKNRKEEEAAQAAEEAEQAPKAARKKAADLTEPPKKRKLGAASAMDILGFNPVQRPKSAADQRKSIPRKFLKHYDQLVELRDRVRDGLDIHQQESERELDDPSDIPSQDDVGVDTFDRDFALSLMANEQEALYEIDQAIQRIVNGTYGTCEITGEPIDKERLLAVPFTRYSVKGQAEFEAQSRRRVRRGGAAFADAGEEGISLSSEDYED